MEAASCRYTKTISPEDFPDALRNYEAESIFSKVKVLSLTFIRNFAKSFKQLFLGKRFCLNASQEITVFNNVIGLIFCETNLTTRKSVFRRNFQ